VQEDELSEQQIRTGLIEKRLENATKEADDRVDKIQHKLDEANFELKRKEKSVNANISIRKLNIPRFRRSTFGTCRLSQSPARLFGTYCQIRCVIRPSRLNVSLPDIRVMSALDVSPFHAVALYELAFTYLLTSNNCKYRNNNNKSNFFS